MGVVDQKRRLFERIVRLRNAERAVPGNRDIAAVRADLESELGGVLSVNLAAQLLGISHTALARWITAGDVPVVPTPNGRRGVPVGAVVALYESIARERESGVRNRHHLEPAMLEQRSRAERLDPLGLVPAPDEPEDAHDRSQRRALAYHRAIARRLRRPWVDEALHRVWAWRESGRIDPRYADEWEAVLRRPVREVARIIGEDTRYAKDLRQSSPFSGMLSEPERRRILETVR